MDNNNPMQSITEQFDLVFDKAIGEIEEEEASLEEQIRQLTEKKMALSRRRELLTDLRAQVEDLTEGIRAADEQYGTEIKKKEELDAEIQQTANALEHLNASRQEIETRVENAQNEKRAKHEQLAQMSAQFGENVKIERDEHVVAALEQTILDTDATESQASLESEPAIGVSPIPDEEPVLGNNASPLSAELPSDEAEDVPEQSERIPETVNIGANLEAAPPEFEDTPSEEADNQTVVFTPQSKPLDETGPVKQLLHVDHSDDQIPTGVIDVDFDELTHDGAEDEASEDGLLRLNEVESQLSPIASSDPQTEDEPSDEDDVIDVDFDELLSPDQSEEKQTTEETRRKRGNLLTRLKPRS